MKNTTRVVTTTQRKGSTNSRTKFYKIIQYIKEEPSKKDPRTRTHSHISIVITLYIHCLSFSQINTISLPNTHCIHSFSLSLSFFLSLSLLLSYSIKDAPVKWNGIHKRIESNLWSNVFDWNRRARRSVVTAVVVVVVNYGAWLPPVHNCFTVSYSLTNAVYILYIYI